MQPGSGGMAGAGMATQALSSFAQGYAGYRAGMANARIARANAQMATMDGATAATASDARYRAAIGEQLAAQGASGFQMGTGSALDAVVASRVNQTFAGMQIERQAAARAAGYRSQAEMSKFGATQALLTGITNAASGMMTNIHDYATAGQQWANGGGGGGSGASGALAPSTWNPAYEVGYG